MRFEVISAFGMGGLIPLLALRGEIEPYNTGIIVGKLAILSIALIALVLSVRRATAGAQT